MGSLQVLSYGISGGQLAIDKRPVYTGLFLFSVASSQTKNPEKPHY